MNAVKVGIIGCGGIISKHLEALKKRADVEIISFCDLVESNAEKARELYGSAESKIFSDYRKLLAEPALDAVYVLTPNKTHCEISIAAMRGKTCNV